jgi:hypothetical protein
MNPTTTTKPSTLMVTTPLTNNPITKAMSTITPDSDTLSMYSQMSLTGSLRRDSVVINNPFFGSVESPNATDRKSFVGLPVSNPFFGSVGSANNGGGLGAVDEGKELEHGDGQEEVVLVKRKTVKTQTVTTGGVRSVGRAGIQSLRGDVVGTIQVPGVVDEHGRQAAIPTTLEEDVPWLVPTTSHLKDRSTGSSYSTSTSSSPGSNFNKPLIKGSVKGATSLSRMDTLAIGNLIKSRAAKIVVGGDVEGQHERAVSMIERQGSIRGVDEAGVEGASGKGVAVVRGRGIKKGEEAERAEGYGEIRRIPVKRTVTPTTTTPSENAALGTPPPANTAVENKTPSPASNNILRRRSRSQSRGRLVPKVSLKRPSTAEGSVDSKDGIKKQVTGDEDTSTPTPGPIPIGRSPSRKYKPKASLSLQQRLVEKGLLSVSTPDLLEGDKGATTLAASSSTVSSPVGPGRHRRQHRRTGSTPTKLSTATQPQESSASAPGQEEKPRLELSTSTSASSSDPTANPNPKHNSLFPLTGAFGLAKSPSKRSPATPTYQYAFADLERTKEFLPVTAPLKVVMGPRTSPGAQGKGQGNGELRKASSAGAKEGK